MIRTDYFGYVDIAYWEYSLSVFYLVVLYIVFARQKNLNVGRYPEYRYLLWGLFAKVFGGVIFSLIYFYYYKGGDTINIAGASTNFDGNLSGSNFILTSPAGANIAIPVGTTGATISFADGSYTLQFNGTNVLLGAQIITETPESLDDLDSMPALSATFGDDTAAGSESSTFG